MGTLFQATSSLNHLLNSEHDLNFDQREDVKPLIHGIGGGGGSNGTPSNINIASTDDDDDCTSRHDGSTLINNDINE